MPTLSENLISMLKNAPLRQRPFGAQRGGQRKRNLKCFSDMLYGLSGGSPVSLLRDFFSSRGGRSLLEQLGLEPKDTSQQLIGALRSLHASASSRKRKREVLAAVPRVLSRRQLWDLGFRFSPATFTKARKSARNGASTRLGFQSVVSNAQSVASNAHSAVSDAQSAAPNVQSVVSNAQSAVPNGQPSPPAASDTESLLLRFFEDHSREAANRTTTLKRKACSGPDCDADDHPNKRYVQLMVDWLLGLSRTANITLNSFSRLRCVVAVRYLNDSKLQLSYRFKEAYPGIKMSRSTFCKRVPEHYKKPTKLTDLCHVCEDGKRDEAALRRMEQRQRGSEASDVQRDAYECLQRRVDYYRLHKRLVDVQRECYNSEVVSRTRPWCA
jgi:hypothetical protein